MEKKTNIRKTTDELISNIIKLILLVSSLISNILLNYLAVSNTYGIPKTIFIILLLLVLPITAMCFATNLKNKKDRHFVLCAIKIVWSIVLSVFYISFFKSAIPTNITIPFYIIVETISNLCFIFRFNKTNNLLINIKSLFTTTAMLLMSFFLINMKLWIILLALIFLPTLIIYFGMGSKK